MAGYLTLQLGCYYALHEKAGSFFWASVSKLSVPDADKSILFRKRMKVELCRQHVDNLACNYGTLV